MSKDDETLDADYADTRNYYKVEIWTADGKQVTRMIYAGNNLEKARALLNAAIVGRPQGRMTIRQGSNVVTRHPQA
jgi:hypothetical protein